MNGSTTARKYILKTRNQGNNKYWDTSFQLRPPFRANSCGQYKITVNEAMFQNTEPLAQKDDYFLFEIFGEKDTEKYKFEYKITMTKDFYLYRQGGTEWGKVQNLLIGKLGKADPSNPDKYTYQITTKKAYRWMLDLDTGKEDWYIDADVNIADLVFNIAIKDENNGNYQGKNAGVYPIMYYDIEIGPGGNNALPNDIVYKSIRMNFSWGFCYILNDTSTYVYEVTDNNMKPSNTDGTAIDYTKHHYFEFCNIRIGGPYEYILDAPTVKVDVMTMNEENQAFNIVGHVTNTANNHNENVQFISSMEGKVNALSNFRVRLLNDNFDPVKIRSPLTILFTVSNEDD